MSKDTIQPVPNELKGNTEKMGATDAKKKISTLLMRYTDDIRDFGWNLEISESENEEPSGSFGDDLDYRGVLTVRFKKDNEFIMVAKVKASNSSSRRMSDSDDPNDYLADNYFYSIDLESLTRVAKPLVKRMKYLEAGGHPGGKVWPITPDRLYKFYPRYFNSKILIDGWANSFDTSKSGESQELTSEQIQNTENVVSAISQALIEVRKNKPGSEPVAVTAGNSAGVMRLISEPLVEAESMLLYALPESKSPEKYIVPGETLLVQAPSQGEDASKWGDELVGETGIASAEFRVRTVFLIGGGANLEQQLPIYLNNILEAKRKGKMYIIVAVQGVGGASSKEKLFVSLEKFARDEKYKSLFPRQLESQFLPDWLQLLDPNDEKMRFQIDELIFRTQMSDLM